MPDLHIRLANFDDPRDAAAIVELVDDYAQEPHGGGHSLPEEVKQRMVAGMKQVPTAFTLLAWQGNVAVGGAICFGGYSTFAAAPLVNVHDLTVRNGYRGQNIGSRLLQAVEAEARRRGCCKITLEVRLANPDAERLYRRLGFMDPSHFPTRFLDKPLV